MNEHKQSRFIIDVSALAKRPNRSTTRFFSYDSHTAEIVIQAEKEGKLIDRTLVDTVDIYFESVNQQYLPTKKLLWNDTMEIGIDGLYSYVLPDDFLNYEGLVAFDVYINYKNGDKADSSNRIIFEQRMSAIDRTAGAVELVYIKDMEIAKQEVAQKAKEAMSVMAGYESSLSDYEHQIKDGMDQLYDGVVRVSTDEITNIQAILPDVQATAADETAKIKAQLPIVEDVAVAETEKIQAELPKVQSVTAEETTKIQSELPEVQSVATVEIGKIRDVISTVDRVAQEVSDHADQKIAEYDANFVSTDQKMAELEQSQGELDAELKVTQQQIADVDVYTKAEADVNTSIILDARNLSPAWSWSKDGTDRFTTIYPNENLLSQSNTIEKKWINSDGTIINLANGFISEFLPVNVGEAYTLTQIETEPTVGVVAVYDSNKQFISRPYGNNGSVYKFSIDVANAAFIRIAEKSSTGKLKEGIKLEHGNVQTIYTPAPSEDPLNAYPIYKGLRLAPSDNPADYDWSYTDEYVDYLKTSSVSKTEFNDLAARLAALENQ